MLRKFLFVGLGGSGGKTLRYLRRDLLAWLREHDLPADELPAGWQLLHIDSPTEQDGSEISNEVDMLPASNYLGLVAAGVSLRAVSDQLGMSGDAAWRELVGWKVDPAYLNVPIGLGAGQYRAIGRSIGLTYAGEIFSALQRAEARMRTADATAELNEFHRKAYGALPGDATGEPLAVVVSSLAGGTGAGLLVDVCDLLRNLPGEWSGKSLGILYSSDVFNEIGEGAGGLDPNALAVLSEVLNGYWLTGSTPRVSQLFNRAGAASPLQKSGPAFPFLVGASNARGVSFGNQKSVYAMMGRALKSWTTDPALQADIQSFVVGNWENAASTNAPKAEVVVRDHPAVFNALGYAEVSLGLDRFEKYAAQRLARVAAEWLLEAHDRQARENDPNDSRPSDEIAKAVAEEQLISFLNRCGLNERGEDNQIIDTLISQQQIDEMLARLTGKVLGLASEGVSSLNSQRWTTRISDLLETGASELEADYDEIVRDNMRSWIDQIPGTIIGVIEDFIQRFGLRVAIHLIERVQEELGDVANELQIEADERRRWSHDYRSAVSAELPASGNIKADHPAVEQAVREGLYCLGVFRAEARRRQLALEAMTELTNGFLAPLHRALRNAASDLTVRGFTGDGNEPPVVPTWPQAAVPDELIPPINEQLMIPIDDYRDLFDDLLEHSTSAEFAGQRVPEARGLIITGEFLDEQSTNHQDVPRAVTVHQEWHPDPILFHSGPDKQAGQLRAHFGPEHLLNRAAAWLHRDGSAFQRFLSSDIRSYLDDDDHIDPAELGKRRARFRTALTAALASAEPLVRIDTGLLALVHGTADVPNRAVPSSIPLKDHPLEAEVRQILVAGTGDENLSGIMTTSSNETSISISSTLGKAHDPVVMESIMRPIVAGWSKVKNQPVQRNSFWNSRRARPIGEFIPASQEIILAMTRGWFTGVLLGLIDTSDYRIAHEGSTVSFPSPLLTQPATTQDRLPVILESLGLAYAEMAQTHSLAPLAPYIALRNLGCSPNVVNYRQQITEYRALNDTLLHWVTTGEVKGAISEGVAIRRAAGSDDIEGRRTAALDAVKSAHERYQELLADFENSVGADPSRLSAMNELWPGMYDTIERALVQLEQRLRDSRFGAGDQDDM